MISNKSTKFYMLTCIIILDNASMNIFQAMSSFIFTKIHVVYINILSIVMFRNEILLKEMVVECTVDDEQVLNTSDHVPVRVILDLNLIPRTTGLGNTVRSIKWSKMSKERIVLDYTRPLDDMLGDMDRVLNT